MTFLCKESWRELEGYVGSVLKLTFGKQGHLAGSPMQTEALSTCSQAISASVAILKNNDCPDPIHRLRKKKKQKL